MKIIQRRKIWYILSSILIIPGIIALFVWGLNIGIDFKGGSLIEVDFGKKIDSSQVQKALEPVGIKDITVRSSGKTTYLLRSRQLNDEEHQKITVTLKQGIGESKEIRFENIGPLVGKDLTRKAFWAVGIASLAIILYLAWAFRKVPKPASSWRFGVCAVIALIHDALFVIGFFAILGHFTGFEIDPLFISAILTIIGFSVHDTIVVFDRIRENLRRFPFENFETNVNNSVIQTLPRSINTTMTVLIMLLSLYLLGGETIRNFVLVLLIGIAIGTYSSIFNASALLVSWTNWAMRKRAQKE